LGTAAFVGCDADGDDDPSQPPFVSFESNSPLIGTWELSYGTSIEAYRITADGVKYGSGSGEQFDPNFEARILGARYFTDGKDAGMLYIEYNTAKKPQYYSGSYDENWDFTQTGGPFDPPGNFVVVMFHDLKTVDGTTTIKLANPYSASDTHSAKGTDGTTDVTFTASEVPTLPAALDKFNIDTEPDFVAWSGVSAQTKVNP
jgi:hypothetical protein